MYIDDLPDEILKQILSYIENEGNNCIYILLTSKRFQAVGLCSFNYSAQNCLALRYAVSKGNTEVEIRRIPRLIT